MLHPNDYYYDVVRTNIKRCRKEAGLTQKELAHKASFEENTIAKIESQSVKWNFSLAFVGNIADALDIDIRELFKPIE